MHPTKNSIPDNTRTALVEVLHARLVDTLDLASQTKQAHWNIKGSNFIALHELFDQLHSEAVEHGDEIAERMVALGGQAKGTVRASASDSSLDEYPLDARRQEDHIEALSNALAKYGHQIRNSIHEVSEIGDPNTEGLFTDISTAVEKSLWMVESHSHI